MKKSIIYILMALFCLTTTTSCVASAYAETTVGNDDDIQVIVRYGTPYDYYNGMSYYYYGGYWYYLYQYNGVWRYHRYSRPLPPPPVRHRQVIPHRRPEQRIVPQHRHNNFQQHRPPMRPHSNPLRRTSTRREIGRR